MNNRIIEEKALKFRDELLNHVSNINVKCQVMY